MPTCPMTKILSLILNPLSPALSLSLSLSLSRRLPHLPKQGQNAGCCRSAWGWRWWLPPARGRRFAPPRGPEWRAAWPAAAAGVPRPQSGLVHETVYSARLGIHTGPLKMLHSLLLSSVTSYSLSLSLSLSLFVLLFF